MINEFPKHRISLVLQKMQHRFTLYDFATMYRSAYGHEDTKGKEIKSYSWKKLADQLKAAGAHQCGPYAIHKTRFICSLASSPEPKEAPQIALPLPKVPDKEPTVIERMEAKLAELQRVLQLQQQIKDIETQIEKF